MNKQMHRLVFDRRRGMRVPAAEHVRGVGKAAGGQTRAVAAACAAVAVTLLAQEDAQAEAEGLALCARRNCASRLCPHIEFWSIVKLRACPCFVLQLPQIQRFRIRVEHKIHDPVWVTPSKPQSQMILQVG